MNINIKLVCFDFDGVFTNSSIYFDNNVFNKKYNIKDGMALFILRKNNIKTGLITGFKNKQYKINDIDINFIGSHLKFDFIELGSENKLETLKKFILNLDISLDEVAYIGDDINDIEIMSCVGFSGCPSDAVIECKNIADYICEKKGGECCVREFVDKIIELNYKSLKKYNKILSDIKTEADYQLNNLNIQEIENIAQKIVFGKINKTIYCTGVGKSENISIHCSNLLKSIGIKSYHLNCLNSIHGDIGMIKENDIILLFSKSGNTIELINIIPSLKLHKPYIITISCNNNNILNSQSDSFIVLPLKSELEGNINTIPTNSYMVTLFFVNILIMIITDLTNLDQYKYKLNHPGGNIGFNLMCIKDLIIKEYPKIIINNISDNVNLSDIFLEMTKYSIGCCFFINNEYELLGLLSDGDIRRLLCNRPDIKIINLNDINTKYHYETELDKMINQIENKNRYKFIPVLQNKKLIGIIKC